MTPATNKLAIYIFPHSSSMMACTWQTVYFKQQTLHLSLLHCVSCASVWWNPPHCFWFHEQQWHGSLIAVLILANYLVTSCAWVTPVVHNARFLLRTMNIPEYSVITGEGCANGEFASCTKKGSPEVHVHTSMHALTVTHNLRLVLRDGLGQYVSLKRAT